MEFLKVILCSSTSNSTAFSRSVAERNGGGERRLAYGSQRGGKLVEKQDCVQRVEEKRQVGIWMGQVCAVLRKYAILNGFVQS